VSLKCGYHIHICRFTDSLEKREAFGPLIMDESLLCLQTKIQDIGQAEVEDIIANPYWGRELEGRVKTWDGEF
jgi:hypothetical protein